MILMTTQRIGQTVVGDIDQKIEIRTADRFFDHTLGFTGAEPGYGGIQNIRIPLITRESKRIFMLTLALSSPIDKIVIYFFAQRFTAFQRNDAKRDNGDGLKVSFLFAFGNERIVTFCP